MAIFTVSSIIDGDTFTVTPSWQWSNQSGDRVRPTGYDAPELSEFGGSNAKDELARLIMGRQVDLRTAYKIDRGRLVCDVYFAGKSLADYFARYRT